MEFPTVPTTASVTELVRFLELQQVHLNELSRPTIQHMIVEELNAEPGPLRNNLVAMADGTNWDPGQGRGLYRYNEADSMWQYMEDGAVVPGGSQYVWHTFIADSGTVDANAVKDTLTITGGTNVTTSITGDTLTIDATGATQNIWLTINSDSGSTAANASNDTLTIAGGTGITTSILGDTLTINATGAPDQNLWETVTADTGSTTANTTTDNLTIAGSGVISTSITGDTLTISSTGDADQNLWETVSADSGSAVANTTTDNLTIAGSGVISTAIVGDTLTISSTGEPDQNLWLTVSADTGATSANSTIDTLIVSGGTGISTSIVGDLLTITNTEPNIVYPDQSIWLTIDGDSGSTSANTTTDVLTIAGGTGISTAMVGDTLTVTNTEAAGTSLSWTYQYADTSPGPTPGTGWVRFSNAAGMPGITQIWLSATASNGAIMENTIDKLKSNGGDRMYIQKRRDSSIYIVFVIDSISKSGTAPDEYYTIALTQDDSSSTTVGGLSAINGEEMTVLFFEDDNQAIWQTIQSDSGSTLANTTTDTLTVAGGTGISTAVAGDTLTITNDIPAQNLWETVTSDSGSAVANITTDTLTIAGGTGISTAVVGDTLTVTNDSPNVDQNLFESVLSDSGTAVADTTTDTLSILGGTGISTAVVGDALTITNDSPNVDQNVFVTFGAVVAGSGNGSTTANSTTDNFTFNAPVDSGIEVSISADVLTITNTAQYPGETLPTYEYAEGLGAQSQTFVWSALSGSIVPWTTHTTLTFTPPGTGSQYYIVEWCAEVLRATAFTLVEGRFRSGATSELSRAAIDPGTTLAYGNFSGFSSVTLTGGFSHTFHMDFRPSQPAIDDPYGNRTAFMRNVRIKAIRVNGPI